MTAEKMFEKLGFKQTVAINLQHKKSIQICYERVFDDYAKIKISFFDDVFYGNLYYWDFEKERYKNVGGCSICKELLEAINKQCEELGWIDE